MQPFLALLLLWLGSAIAVFSDQSTRRSSEMLNQHHESQHRQLQDDFDPDRLALFYKAVNAQLESKKIRGAAYAFRGPVR
jgi:hypothetical protein